MKPSISATQLDKLLQGLPIGNRVRRMVFKGMVGGNNYSDPSDSIFATTQRAEGPHVRLEQNGGYRPLDVIYAAQRGDNKELFGVESLPSGYLVWEPSRSGRVRETANMRNAQSLNAF